MHWKNKILRFAQNDNVNQLLPIPSEFELRGVNRMIGILGFILGAAAVAAIALGSRRLKRWETLEPRDAADGDFVALSDGARMHYVARGDSAAGAPVILIHGVMDSTRNWEKNIDELARAHRVEAVDLIGFGFSSRETRARYSLEYYARTLREFMDARGIARAYLVGHSLGGAVALELAARAPARVLKIALINPAVYVINRLASLNASARVPLLPRAILGLALSSRVVRDYAFRRALGDPARFDAAYAEWRRQPTRVKGTADALIAIAAAWQPSDLPARLAQIHAPTLVIAGARDSIVPRRHSERVARELPNAVLRVIANAGHSVYEETPAEIDRLILDFFGAERKESRWTQSG